MWVVSYLCEVPVACHPRLSRVFRVFRVRLESETTRSLEFERRVRILIKGALSPSGNRIVNH